MPSLVSFRPCPRIAAAILLAVLGAGCARPLAVHDEFYSSANASADRLRVRTQHALDHHRARQVALHACGSHASRPVAPEEAGAPDGPDSGAAAARAALTGPCATPARPPVAASGGASNAYRRWVEDRVRELPAASETAASATGGS